MAIDAARGRIVEVSVSFFAHSVLREVTDTAVKTVRDALQTSGHINKSTGRWSNLRKSSSAVDRSESTAAQHSAAPSTKSKRPKGRTVDEHVPRTTLENLAFGDMAGIYNAICNAVPKELNIVPTVNFIHWSNEFAWSAHTNGRFKSDGTGWRKDSLDPRPLGLKAKCPFMPDCVSVEEYNQYDDEVGHHDASLHWLSPSSRMFGTDSRPTEFKKNYWQRQPHTRRGCRSPFYVWDYY